MQYWQNGESSSFFLNRTSNGAMGCYTPSTLSRRTWALILISFSYTFTVELLKEKCRCETGGYRACIGDPHGGVGGGRGSHG